MHFILSFFCVSLQVHAQSSGPLSLKQAVRKAIESNNSILQQHAKVEQMRHDTDAKRALLFPNINLAASKTTLKSPIMSTGQVPFGGHAYNQYNVDLKVIQPLLVFGSLAAISVADYDTKIAEIDLEILVRDLSRNVIEAFYKVLLNERLLDILQTRLKVVNESLTTAQQRLHTGRGQLLDVLQAKTETAMLKPQIEDAHNQLEAAGAELATFLAEQGRTELKLRGALRGLLLQDVQKKVNFKVARLPELERVRMSREQLHQQRDVAEGKHLPNLQLVGDIGALSYTQAELGNSGERQWSVMVQLNIPLFSGFQSIYERRSLVEQDRELDFKGRDTENSLALNQVVSLKKVESTGASLLSSEEAAQLAEQSMTEARRSYRLATIDFVQFLTVQKSALDAYNALDKIKFDNIVALSKYFVATGQPLSVLIDLLEEKKQ